MQTQKRIFTTTVTQHKDIFAPLFGTVTLIILTEGLRYGYALKITGAKMDSDGHTAYRLTPPFYLPIFLTSLIEDLNRYYFPVIIEYYAGTTENTQALYIANQTHNTING